MTAIDSRWSAGPARRFRDDRAKRDIVKDEGLAPMSAVTQDRVMAALRQVIDPDRDKDIVSLGMVSGVQVREGHVGFAIEVDPQRGPKLEPLRKAAEHAVERLEGVLSVTAVLTAEAKPDRGASPARSPARGQAPHGSGGAGKALVP